MKQRIFSIWIAVCLLVLPAVLAGCGPKTYGTFYTLQEAYDNGYLTREDLMSIAYYHHNGREYNEETMPEDYAPIPKDPEELSESTSLRIRSTAAADWNAEYPDDDATAEDFWIDYYYGTYGNCVAVMMTDNFTGYNQVLHASGVADITIQYYDGNRIKIWRANA